MRKISFIDYLFTENIGDIYESMVSIISNSLDYNLRKYNLKINYYKIIDDNWPRCYYLGDNCVIAVIHISCSCKLLDSNDNLMNDFTSNLFLKVVTNIYHEDIILDFIDYLSDGKPDFHYVFKMTDSLVPYIRKEEYDYVAEYLTDQYGGNNIMAMIENSGAYAISFPIFNKFGKYGRTYFENSEIVSFETRRVRCGTIVYDSYFDMNSKIKERNNILAHEFVHWTLHRYYMLLKKYFSDYNDDDFDIKDDIDWIERQATYIAPRVLMPASKLHNDVEEEMYYLSERFPNYKKIYLVPKLINILSDRYCASKQSVKIRLIYIGFNLARGVNEFVNGRYIKDYMFKDGSLKLNQTFTISFMELKNILSQNDYLNNLYENKTLIYLDGHLVLNEKKFVNCDAYGDLSLSNYALFHMDECAVAFNLQYEIGDILEYSFYDPYLNKVSRTLNKVSWSNNGFEFSFIIPDDRTHTIVEENYILNNLCISNHGGTTLKNIIEYKNIKQSFICDKINVDKSTLSKFLSEKEDSSLNLLNIVRICKLLKLPVHLIYKVLDCCKIQLDNSSVRESMIIMAIESQECNSLNGLNSFLEHYQIY